MSVSKGLKRIIAPLVIIVIIPLVIIILFQLGKNQYTPLPYYGNPKGVTAQGDTIRHSIPEFTLTDQTGKPFGSKDLEGKIYVADFFFSRCPSICPVMTGNLKSLHHTFAEKKDFAIVSFTLDPKYDTAQVLAAYEKKYEIDGSRWHFVTGPKEDIYYLMNQDGYLVARPTPSDDPAQFIHSETVVLVDKEGHVRGFYDGTKEADIKNLEEDIRYLYYMYGKDNSK